MSPTDAGQRLLLTVARRFKEIEAELASLGELRDKPAGTVRITTSDHAADTILLPKLAPLLLEYPDLKLEINTDYELVDIVEQRYDAGVRLGEQVAKDMIATRVGPDTRMIVNGFNQMTKAALAGLGLAFTLEDAVQPRIDEGRLVRVLEEWCPRFTGYHLYYPSRRQPPPAFSLVLDALRLG